MRTELKKGAAPGGCESGWGAAQGFVGRALGDPGLKPTVRVGEAAMREVAAYLLDHERFARVPTTALSTRAPRPSRPLGSCWAQRC